MHAHGRAIINPSRPRASAICDRCGFLYLHEDLAWQREWAGTRLINTNFLVCDTCMDVPNQTLRTIRLRPDPLPIRDPRPGNDRQDMVDYLSTEDGLGYVSEDGVDDYVKDEDVIDG